MIYPACLSATSTFKALAYHDSPEFVRMRFELSLSPVAHCQGREGVSESQLVGVL